jgi:hypothetical protein
MKKNILVSFLSMVLLFAVCWCFTGAALANPLPVPTGGTVSSGGVSGAGGQTLVIGTSGGGASGSGGSAADDSGCSLGGSRTVSDVGPWLLACACAVPFLIVRRRRRG